MFNKEQQSLYKLWAINELKLIEPHPDKDGYKEQKEVNNMILDIIDVFDSQGHTGFSAGYFAQILKRLLDYKPLKPLTGEDDEWDEPYDAFESSDIVKQQNKRCSAVFRENFDNKTTVYIHGKVFSDDNGKTWYSSRESRIPVTFPFVVPSEPEYVLVEPAEHKGFKREHTHSMGDADHSQNTTEKCE